MALEKLNENVEIVQTLSTNPNQEDGLDAEELKAKFDKGAKIIKEYLNEEVVPAVNAAVTVEPQKLTPEQKAQIRKNIGASEHGNVWLEYDNLLSPDDSKSNIHINAEAPITDEGGDPIVGRVAFYEAAHDGACQLTNIADGTEKNHVATVGQVVLSTPQTLTEAQKAQARENMGITYFGVPYSSAEKVIDLSDTVKMYLFATADGYDAVLTGEGAIPSYEVTGNRANPRDVITVNRPFDAKKINRLHICDGITSIGDNFMFKVPNLKHLSFDDSTKIQHLGSYAFAVTGISGEYDFSGLSDTTIDHVFQFCPKLEGIIFNGNITNIAARSFRGCISLRYIKNIAKNGTALTLENGSFWYCTSLESIDVDPANTTLGNWVFMFVPIDAKTESGTKLDSALWKAQGDMCFVQHEWTTAQLEGIANVNGKSVQLTIPKSDTQSTDFNKKYGVLVYKNGEGKFTQRYAEAFGLCGYFSLFHVNNVVHPNEQFNTFYDFVEKGIVPNKIEVTQELHDALISNSVGQQLISDMSGIVSYEVGSKVSAIDLPNGFLDSSTYGDLGTAFWGFCEALGWTATEFKFKDRKTDSATDRNNCGAEGKELVLNNLSAGKPVVMEVVGAASSADGAHMVTVIGYDADTDRFLIIDSTGDFPADVVPLLYWVKFESLITPAKDSAIWTFDFGEEITMTNIDNKLNALLGTVNSGFHSVEGTLELANDVPSAGNSAASRYRVECPSGAKIFVFVADEATATEIKKRTDKFYTLGVNCNFTNGTTENDKQCLVSVWAGAQARKTTGGLTADNVDGVSFDSYTLVAGTYHWTAYYWNN
jgi:hypothetical protein